MKPLLALLFLFTLSDTLLALPIPQPPQQDDRPSFSWKKYFPFLGVLGVIGTGALIAFGIHKANEAHEAHQILNPEFTSSKLEPVVRNYLNRYIGSETPEKWDENQKKQREADEELAKAFVVEMPDLTGMDMGMRKELEREHKKVEMAMEKVDAAIKWREKQEMALRDEEAKVGVIVATDWREALAEANASREVVGQ
jgi:hypothetical protein